MAVIVLDGSTFFISDERGDVGAGEEGLYANDTRHLSRLVLTLDGERPLPLAGRTVEHFSAAFHLRNAPSAGLPPDALLVVRDRFVGGGLQERISVRSQVGRPLAFELALEVGADFADIITVKEQDVPPDGRVGGRVLPPPARLHAAGGAELLLGDGPARTQVALSRPAEVDGGTLRFRIELAPREQWELEVDVVPLPDGGSPGFAARRAALERSLAGRRARMPRLRSADEPLRLAYERSLADLAALRLESGVPAAGMPWFMTVFGRDAIIASLQTLLLGPDLAAATLARLTELQARADDPAIDAEPGKILHELRGGEAARTWFPRYYGSVDATPLYLVLLSELWRWTDDAALVERFKEPALAALAWIDDHGDRDGDGFVEYERRTPRGLPNQSWKDSHDSQRFADGRFAQTPIAPCEVQGYVYDAKQRLAEIARQAWRDPALAERLEREAGELRARFDEAYWVDRRGGFYALALDGEKRQVDSLCSNVGHLLWSGIVPDHRVQPLVEALLGDELWSGWGVRTMSTADAAYNPLGYHVGTVWPHDGSLIAQGLARYGRGEEARRVARGLLDAAGFFDGELPEVFAGIPRADAPFPVPYPMGAHPQAWGAGAAVLLLQVLLGLRPDRATRTLQASGTTDLAATRLTGVPAFGRAWDVEAAAGLVHVAPAGR